MMLTEDEIATALQEEGSLKLVSPINLPGIWSYLHKNLKENSIEELITFDKISAESINTLLQRVTDLEPSLVSRIDFSFVRELPDEYREDLTTTLTNGITKHTLISQELKAYINTLISPTPSYNLRFDQDKLLDPHIKIYTLLKSLVRSKELNHPIMGSFQAMFLDPEKTDQEKLLELQKNVFNHCYEVCENLPCREITYILSSLGVGVTINNTNRTQKRTIANNYSVLFSILFDKSNSKKVEELTTADIAALWDVINKLISDSNYYESEYCRGLFFPWVSNNLKQDWTENFKTKVVINLRQNILVNLINRIKELNSYQLDYVELKVLLEQINFLEFEFKLFPKELSKLIMDFVFFDANNIVDLIYNAQSGIKDESILPKIYKMIQIAGSAGTVEKLSPLSLKKIIITMREPVDNWRIKGQFWHYMDFQKEWLDAIYKISKQSTKLDDKDVLNLIELICEIPRGEIPLELYNRLNKDIISEITDLELLLKLKNHVSKQVQTKAELRLKEKDAESKIAKAIALQAAKALGVSNEMPTPQLSQDIDDKILWFITKIDTDYDGATTIIEIIDKFPGPLPENIALAILQREDLEKIMSKSGLNPDLLKKTFHNIDLEIINTKLTSEVLLGMSPQNIISSITLLSDENIKKFTTKLLKSEIEKVAIGEAFAYRYNDYYHKNFKRRPIILEIAKQPEMIERLEKLAETDRDFATTLTVFNQEKDQSELDGALKKILQKTNGATTKLKPRFLAETEDELTREHEGLKRCVAEIETLIEGVGEDELQAKLRADIDTELQKLGESTSLDDLKAEVIRYKESIKKRILGVIQEYTESIIRYKATLKDKGKTVRNWGFDTSLRDAARTRAYNTGFRLDHVHKLYPSVEPDIKAYRKAERCVGKTLKNIDTLIKSHLKSGHEDLPTAQKLQKKAKREMRNYLNSKDVKQMYIKFRRQTELDELIGLCGALPPEGIGLMDSGGATAPHQEPGGAGGAARCRCIQSIRKALGNLKGCGARPLRPL